MKETGKQYERADNLEDPTGFKASARLHQSRFRAENLNLDCDRYGNFLKMPDGKNGKNFYGDFGIFDAVECYRNYNTNLYSNMLRSEHIPFNFFIPFRYNTDYCKKVFNEILDGCIKSIDLTTSIDCKMNIKIEFAPKPKSNYFFPAESGKADSV